MKFSNFNFFLHLFVCFFFGGGLFFWFSINFKMSIVLKFYHSSQTGVPDTRPPQNIFARNDRWTKVRTGIDTVMNAPVKMISSTMSDRSYVRLHPFKVQIIFLPLYSFAVKVISFVSPFN